MKIHAINAMEKGAIPQFTKTVNNMGFVFFLIFIISVNFILSMIGYIINSSTTAIGIETFAYSNSANILDVFGKKYLMIIPAKLQTAVQNERYLLKKSNSL